MRCLVPRLVTGQFDPSHDRAVWPSTGNYCRGGVAISRILGCRGVAVLPAGMSRERFEWLKQWVADPADIIRTPGTESNVKEIYDKCAELSRDDKNVILNQFSEFANYLIHYHCTGQRVRPACSAHLGANIVTMRLGSVRLGDRFGRHDRRRRSAQGAARLEDCRGRGARMPDHALQRLRRAQHPGHRRQAHPAHSQRDEHRCRHRACRIAASDALNLLFRHDVGRGYLGGRRKIDPDLVAAVRGHRHFRPGQHRRRHQARQAFRLRPERCRHDGRDRQRRRCTPAKPRAFMARRYPDGFDEVNAGEIFARHLEGIADDHVHGAASYSTASASSISAITPGSSSRASRSKISIAASSQDFWRSLVDSIPALGSTDPGLQCRGRRQELNMSSVQPYGKLRKDMAQRDRSLREKVVSLEEAVSFVARRRLGRHRRQHHVAHADGPDLGARSAPSAKSSPARAASSPATAICCSARAPASTSSRAGSARASCGASPR